MSIKLSLFGFCSLLQQQKKIDDKDSSLLYHITKQKLCFKTSESKIATFKRIFSIP